jgi:hypothetical protein
VPRQAEADLAALDTARGDLTNAWSKAEGLPLFLLIERFDPPDWRARSLGPQPPSPFELLAEGLARK